ncbi:SdiA-regulated domain-containing protein [Terrimonas alba]|uniref:SdiA-regulated domain-containing protein n=1 Tax=Terrimonas alba TaxID=3349636 RepID=UPI0035F2B462
MTLSFLFIQCSSDTQPTIVKSPPGYNMKTTIQVKLPLELDEISGVAYYPVDSSIFAINDEKGWLYKIKKRGREIQRWKFSPGADFEDVVLLDSIFYVLQSNGNIMRLTFSEQNTVNVQQFYFDKSGQSVSEFEILYYDPVKQKMILICKDCELDKKKSLTTFSFDPHSGQYSDSSFRIDVTKIAAAIGEEKIRFKPSAASINPKTGELFIISAINKLLVVADTNGQFKQAYKIDPGIFKQPEGLTFTPAGDLIISNEAADVGVADILFFTYQNKRG